MTLTNSQLYLNQLSLIIDSQMQDLMKQREKAANRGDLRGMTELTGRLAQLEEIKFNLAKEIV